MNRLTIPAIAIVAMLAAAPAAHAWGPYDYGDGTTLSVSRVELGAGIWEWTYCLYNGGGSTNDYPLHQFSVGLIEDDTAGLGIGNPSTGHYWGYGLNGSAWNGVVELPGNAMWYGFEIGASKSATFSFKTNLAAVGFANHDARDGVYAVFWEGKETPKLADPTPPSVPEPMSFALGLLGLGAMSGLRRLRK